MGAFILFAGDEQYVGLSGEASRRVGDLAPAWGFGLLAVGVVTVLLDAAPVRWDRRRLVPDAARGGPLIVRGARATGPTGGPGCCRLRGNRHNRTRVGL